MHSRMPPGEVSLASCKKFSFVKPVGRPFAASYQAAAAHSLGSRAHASVRAAARDGIQAASVCAAAAAQAAPTSDGPEVVALDVEYIHFESSTRQPKQYKTLGEVAVVDVDGNLIYRSFCRQGWLPSLSGLLATPMCVLVSAHSSSDADDVHGYVTAQFCAGLQLRACQDFWGCPDPQFCECCGPLTEVHSSQHGMHAHDFCQQLQLRLCVRNLRQHRLRSVAFVAIVHVRCRHGIDPSTMLAGQTSQSTTSSSEVCRQKSGRVRQAWTMS